MLIAARNSKPLMAALLLCAPLAACAVLSHPLLHPAATMFPVPSAFNHPLPPSFQAVQEIMNADRQHQQCFRAMRAYNAYCRHAHKKPDPRIIQALTFDANRKAPAHVIPPHVRQLIQKSDTIE